MTEFKLDEIQNIVDLETPFNWLNFLSKKMGGGLAASKARVSKCLNVYRHSEPTSKLLNFFPFEMDLT